MKVWACGQGNLTPFSQESQGSGGKKEGIGIPPANHCSRKGKDVNETIAYKPHLEEVLIRLRGLYERQAEAQIFAAMEVPSQALAQFREKHHEGFCDYPDPTERIAFWDALLRERAAVEDDSIPSAYLSEFDQGLYGGLLGGDVRFLCHPENGWISSMVPPLLRDWSEFDRLRFDETHEWFQRYRRQLEIFVAGAAGKFGISHFILIDSLNFVFELFGATRTYAELFDHPEQVRQAIDFAFDLNVRVQETFFHHVPGLAGGTYSNMVQWIPGRIVSESVDPFHMTSVDYFEEWGREPVERIFAHFDGGVLHLHGNGRHLLPAVRSLRGLKAIYLADDRGFPPAFEVLGDLKASAGDLPLLVAVDFEPFRAALKEHRLIGGVFYQVRGVPDTDTANEWMEQVRGYRV